MHDAATGGFDDRYQGEDPSGAETTAVTATPFSHGKQSISCQDRLGTDARNVGR